MTAIPLSQLATSRRWQANFLSVLPVVRSHAAISFRHLPPEARAEATAHAVASAVVSYHGLASHDKLSRAYPSTIATFAVRTVNGGRQVGGHINSKDVLNPLAQKRRNFGVKSVSPWDRQEGDWRDMVLETRRASPADQAAFNIDFHDWLRTWSRRDRRIIYQLAAGNGTFVVAGLFKVSPARISQLRRRYRQSWLQFQGMPIENPRPCRGELRERRFEDHSAGQMKPQRIIEAPGENAETKSTSHGVSPKLISHLITQPSF